MHQFYVGRDIPGEGIHHFRAQPLTFRYSFDCCLENDSLFSGSWSTQCLCYENTQYILREGEREIE